MNPFSKACKYLVALTLIFSSFARVANADESAPTPLVHSKEIENNHYAAGAIAGTLIGFGLGHAIQDRYTPKGLIFTTSEAASVSLFILGAQNIDSPGHRSGSGILAPIGLVAFVGLRVWEMIDVWTHPSTTTENFKNQAEQSKKFSPRIVPLLSQNDFAPKPGLAFQMNF